MLMVPAFITTLLYWTPDREMLGIAALAIFLAACVTDGLDGWIARRTGQKTRLGSLLDPMADKILLTSAYFALAWLPNIPESARIPAWLAVVVLSRDIMLVGGAAVIFVMQHRFETQTNYLGKLTTVLQMVLIIVSLAGAPKEFIPLMAIAVAVVTVLSGIIYLQFGSAKLGGGLDHA